MPCTNQHYYESWIYISTILRACLYSCEVDSYVVFFMKPTILQVYLRF